MKRQNARAACGLAILVLSLSGCGSSAPNRVGGGAAGGAATGATFGLIGGPVGVIVGGAIGGGIGALTAANTTPKQVNLGNPPLAGRTGSTQSTAGPTDSPLPASTPQRQVKSQAFTSGDNAVSEASQNDYAPVKSASDVPENPSSNAVQAQPLPPP